MAQDVTGQVDVSAIVDGQPIDASDVTTPFGDVTGLINDILNGVQDADAIRFSELAGNPTTPAAGRWKLFTLATGLHLMDDAGVVTGPLGDASGVTFTPAVLPNWDSSTDPGNVDDALDQLADRITVVEGGGGGGGAPDNATFITQTPSAGLSAEQALSTLATGLLKNTTSTGVLSIATGSDLPGHNHAASDINSGTLDAARLPAMVGDSGSGGTQGAVPAPGAGDATNFLRGDGTWAAASGGGGDLVEIVANTVLVSETSSISLTSISGSYSHLRIVMRLRSDRAGETTDGVNITFNSDTTSNYTWIRTGISGAGVVAGNGSNSDTGIKPDASINGASGVTNTFGTVIIDIPNYAGTGYARTLHMTSDFWIGGGAIGRTVDISGNWFNTADAITQIDIAPLAGSNFVAGSSYSLYGIG